MIVRCLLVDDNDRFLETARTLLERDGIDVAGVATTSAQALQRTAKLHPDLVLIDIALGPELGFDLADTLTASAAIGYLPKTHLSGSAIRALINNTGPGRRRLTGVNVPPIWGGVLSPTLRAPL